MDATVIGKENCYANPNNDYWLLELEPADGKVIGDEVEVGGILYKHVVKTKGLPNDLKKTGQHLRIGYDVLSSKRVLVNVCDVSSPVQYEVYEIPILASERL
ncbi:hypothetical protein [Pedobacter sp. GR22-6]|uniref:hypothetical protein n=1 Tax=Pedobacter sp. GR22-6 TaxID=3127957 RepID=UPI00307F96BD